MSTYRGGRLKPPGLTLKSDPFDQVVTEIITNDQPQLLPAKLDTPMDEQHLVHPGIHGSVWASLFRRMGDAEGALISTKINGIKMTPADKLVGNSGVKETPADKLVGMSGVKVTPADALDGISGVKMTPADALDSNKRIGISGADTPLAIAHGSCSATGISGVDTPLAIAHSAIGICGDNMSPAIAHGSCSATSISGASPSRCTIRAC